MDGGLELAVPEPGLENVGEFYVDGELVDGTLDVEGLGGP